MKRPSHPHTAPVKPSGRRHICVRIGLDGKLGRCAQEGVLVAAHVRRQLRQVLAGPRPWHQRRRRATARAAAAVAGFRAQAEHGVQPRRAGGRSGSGSERAAVGRATKEPQWVGQQNGRSGSGSRRAAVGQAAKGPQWVGQHSRVLLPVVQPATSACVPSLRPAGNVDLLLSAPNVCLQLKQHSSASPLSQANSPPFLCPLFESPFSYTPPSVLRSILSYSAL